LLFFLVQK